MKLKIGTKLMVAGAAIVLIPFAAMGIIVSVKSSGGITSIVENQLQNITKSMADFAEIKIEGDLNACRSLAASSDIEETVGEGNSGRPGARASAAALSSKLSALYKKSQFGEVFNDLFVVDASGHVCSAAVQASYGVDLSEREYVKRALAGEANISQMLVDKVSNQITFAVAVPISGASGKPQGACCLLIKTDVITEEMSRFSLGKGSYFAVIDSKGLFVIHPDKNVALKVNINDMPGLEAVSKRARARDTGTERFRYKGEAKACGFAPIPSLGWIVMAQIPEREFLATARDIETIILTIAGIASVIALACLYFLSRSISLPIRLAAEHASTLANGDLTREVPPAFLARGDELGALAAAFESMSINLKRVVVDIQSSAESVSQGSENISETAQGMSQGSTEQAASAEEVSSSVEEMAATIKQNSDNASATEGIATKAAKDAETGSQVVDKAVEAMKEIADKVGIISEIARQTNMLALNAAIEAARAGESGKGFAVVASEVRKLAERSQTAAGEITALSASTVALAQDAGKIIGDIVPDIKKTADLVREIAAASREQSVGVEQIGKAMIQLDTVIQTNASASEELASMSEEFSGQAQQLAQTVGFFKMAGVAESPLAAKREAESPAKAAPAKGKVAKAGPTGPISRAIAPVPDKSDGDFEEF